MSSEALEPSSGLIKNQGTHLICSRRSCLPTTCNGERSVISTPHHSLHQICTIFASAWLLSSMQACGTSVHVISAVLSVPRCCQIQIQVEVVSPSAAGRSSANKVMIYFCCRRAKAAGALVRISWDWQTSTVYVMILVCVCSARTTLLVNKSRFAVVIGIWKSYFTIRRIYMYTAMSHYALILFDDVRKTWAKFFSFSYWVSALSI